MTDTYTLEDTAMILGRSEHYVKRLSETGQLFTRIVDGELCTDPTSIRKLVMSCPRIVRPARTVRNCCWELFVDIIATGNSGMGPCRTKAPTLTNDEADAIHELEHVAAIPYERRTATDEPMRTKYERRQARIHQRMSDQNLPPFICPKCGLPSSPLTTRGTRRRRCPLPECGGRR